MAMERVLDVHALLKKLAFLSELPSKLKECIENDDLATGVRYYLRAQHVLYQYENMSSFTGIKLECDATVVELKSRLDKRPRDSATAPEDLPTYIGLLRCL